MNCSSSPVPSVATTIDCVSPRVNSAEPCVRGRKPTMLSIGRTLSTGAAVDAALFLDDAGADDVAFDCLEGFLEHVGVDAVRVGFDSSRVAALALSRSAPTAA